MIVFKLKYAAKMRQKDRQMEAIRYMSRKQLQNVAAEGDVMEFNRQIAPWVLKNLAKGTKIGVEPLLIHEHIGGQLTESHMRTLVGFKLKSGKIGAAFIDMKMTTFQSLPPIPKENYSLRSEIILPNLQATAG